MRSAFSVILMATLIFAGGYFYNFALAVCQIPVTYRIGTIDERFDLSPEEARVVAAEAAEVWEVATGQNLFAYDDAADFTINFIYDERQATLEASESFEERLERAEITNDALTEKYRTLMEEYNTLGENYENRSADFERRFSTYNETVRRYNEDGGAPREVFEQLEAERRSLEAERDELSDLADNLNALGAQINELSAQGNALIASYNEKVGEFNERFGDTREFTQGEYDGTSINIYTYETIDELRTVLAHELGHALSIDHVEGEDSVMYYLIGGQSTPLALSAADLSEFTRICGEMNVWDKIVYRLTNN